MLSTETFNEDASEGDSISGTQLDVSVAGLMQSFGMTGENRLRTLIATLKMMEAEPTVNSHVDVRNTITTYGDES
ncbi:MAG: hypothetical protein ABGZ17_14485 [Planctomycetaceae bacterium]